MNLFFEQNEAALEEFTRVSNAIGARSDYVQGGGGNTSVKLDGGRMAIKASGYRLCDITPKTAYAVLDYETLRAFYESHETAGLEDVEKAGAAQAKAVTQEIEGLAALRPSVEAGFHSLLSRYVAHSHSVYANLVACAKDAKKLLSQALEGADYAFGFVPYVDPGARLTFSIRDELSRVRRETGRTPAVILMENHGLIAHHDDPDEVLRIHADANERFARFFGLTGESFPKVKISVQPDGSFASATPFVTETLKTKDYSDEFLLTEPLYPDQMVFFTGTLGDTARIDRSTGRVQYKMGESAALTMEETLCAVLFILETLKARGFAVSTMGEQAKRFIANWESEKYRKSLAGGKA